MDSNLYARITQLQQELEEAQIIANNNFLLYQKAERRNKFLKSAIVATHLLYIMVACFLLLLTI